MLGKEYSSEYTVYDGPDRKVLDKGYTFVVMSIDQDGLAGIVMTDGNGVTDNGIYTDYGNIAGSVATGRFLRRDGTLGTANTAYAGAPAERLPDLAFDFED